jgi:GntR family transcriptional regulator
LVDFLIHFHLDARSGMPTYMQLVNQVRRATRNGTLHSGDRLPTAREVVAALAINPNTVLKAYSSAGPASARSSRKASPRRSPPRCSANSAADSTRGFAVRRLPGWIVKECWR